MSNKPKIYGFCAAGCKWETVHKDEFDKSASLIRQRIEDDGSCYLQLGKEYKIFAPKDTDGNFTCTLTFSFLIGSSDGTKFDYNISHTNKDDYADAFTFRFLEQSHAFGYSQIVYELAGVRYKETIPNVSLLAVGLTENYLSVKGATEVFLYNADASIKGEKGDGVPEVTTADDGKFLVVENGAWVAKQITTAEEVEV